MDNSRRTGSSDGRGDQGRQSTSPERQNRPETSLDRERRNMRFLTLVPHDLPSTSNTDHSTPASELDQPGDQDHPQPERWQNMLRNIWHVATLPYRSLRSAIDAINEFRWEPPYHILWDNDNNDDSIPNREKIQELLGMKLEGIKNSTWEKFGQYLVDKYDPFVYGDGPRETSDARLLGDVLRGGLLIDERNSIAYEKVKSLVREEWKMYHAGALLDIDLSEVRPKRWTEFSHDILEKYKENHKNHRYLKGILRGYTADYVPDDGHLKADHVSDEERKSPAYKDLMHLASEEWEEWKRKKAGALLGRDLSEVRPEIWAKISNDVLSQCQDEDEHMLLKDILKGGVTYIKDEIIKSEAYSKLIFFICQKL